jgi:Pilus formation protein N terminal region
MGRVTGTLLLTVFVAATAAASTAQAESTVIHLNQSRRIVLRGTAANIIIGDSSVADVTVLDAHSVILQGKGYGSTDVLVMDRGGRTLLDDHVIVGAAEGGVVTLHRGVNSVEYSCSPRCQALAPPKENGGGGGSPGGSPMAGAPTNPAATPPASQ